MRVRPQAVPIARAAAPGQREEGGAEEAGQAGSRAAAVEGGGAAGGGDEAAVGVEDPVEPRDAVDGLRGGREWVGRGAGEEGRGGRVRRTGVAGM